MTFSYIVLLILVPVAHGLVHKFPRQTSIAEGTVLLSGWAPRPTKGPKLVHEFYRRDSEHYTELQGPDNICGYVSGSQEVPFSCEDPAAFCVMGLPTVSDEYGTLGCCASTGCSIATWCYDYYFYIDTSSCDDTCQEDTMALKCSDIEKQWCHTISFDGQGVPAYSCDSTDDRGPESPEIAYATYDGQVNVVPWDVFTYDLEDSSETSGFGHWPTKSHLESVSSALSSTTHTSSLADTTSSTLSISSSVKFETPMTTAQIVSSQGSETHVGAIVGGVIGGVGLLALILGGAFIIRRKYSRKHANVVHTPPIDYSGKAELDASQSFNPRDSDMADGKQLAHDPTLPQYQPVATEAFKDPYHDHISNSNATGPIDITRLSVLSTNRRPGSSALSIMSVKSEAPSEVEGSSPPPDIRVTLADQVVEENGPHELPTS